MRQVLSSYWLGCYVMHRGLKYKVIGINEVTQEMTLERNSVWCKVLFNKINKTY